MIDSMIWSNMKRALNRDQRGDMEREQAFKLTRAFLDVSECVRYLPQCVISTLVATIEQVDDKFRNVAIETVCEIGGCIPYYD